MTQSPQDDCAAAAVDHADQTQTRRAAGGPLSRVISQPRRTRVRLDGSATGMRRQWLDFLGGPAGKYAAVGQARFFTPLRVLWIVASVFIALAWAFKANCMRGKLDDSGQVVLDWSGSRPNASFCYSDIVPLYGAEGLSAGHFPYAYSWMDNGQVRYMEYPVLTGLFQWVMAQLTKLLYPVVQLIPGHTLPEVGLYYALNFAVLAVVWLGCVHLVVLLAGNRVWDTVLMVASPLVLNHAFANWDILPIYCALAGLWLWRNRRPGWAGVAVGVGAAFKMWPIFILGAFLCVAWRYRTFAALVRSIAAAVVTVVAVNLPIAVLFPAGWREFFRLNQERGWEWTTLYAVASRMGWPGFDGGATPPVILNAVSFGLFALGCAAVLLLALAAQQVPRIGQLVFLIVALFLLTNKVWSPQYSIWLAPLIVLALPRWRLAYAWMTAEAFVWAITFLKIGGDKLGPPDWLFNAVIVLRDGLLVAIMVLIVREVLGRSTDRIRAAHGGLDPLAPPEMNAVFAPGGRAAADVENQGRKSAPLASVGEAGGV